MRPATLEEAEREAQRIAQVVGKMTPRGWGFLLCVAEFSKTDGNMTYVSSCDRSAIPRFCRELADRLETGEGSLDVLPHDDETLGQALTLLHKITEVVCSPYTRCSVQVKPGIEEFIDRSDIDDVVAGMQHTLDTSLTAAQGMVRLYAPELLGKEKEDDG